MSDLKIDVSGYIGVYQNAGLFVDGKFGDINFNLKVAEIDGVEKKLEFIGGLGNTVILQSYGFAELIAEFDDISIDDNGKLEEFRVTGLVRFKVPISSLGEHLEKLTNKKEFKQDFEFCNQLIKA